jgi:predicted secreted hydrolase
LLVVCPTPSNWTALLQIRRADGSIDPFSAGAYVARDGKATHLAAADFILTPLAFWTSPSLTRAIPSGGAFAFPG